MYSLALVLAVARASDPWSSVAKSLVEITAPTAANLHASRFASRSWHVRFHGERLLIAPIEKRDVDLPFAPEIDTAHLGYYGTQPSQVLRIGDAWFLAYYHGEFGGGLWQFDSSGTVGRRLIDDPTYGLMFYRGELLAETQDNSMMVRRVRIHRFALQHGTWQEVAHTDFPRNIGSVKPLGSQLYAIASDYPSAVLAKIDLAGNLTPLWQFNRDLHVADIARSPKGDFAIGGQGYVVQLHRAGEQFIATWYAPRDCVSYSNVEENDGSSARCVGMTGVRNYEAHRRVPGRNPLVSRDGNWILARYLPIQLLHFSGSQWLPADLPSFLSTEYPDRLEVGSSLVVRTNHRLWLRRGGQWRVIQDHLNCAIALSITPYSAWGTDCGDTPQIWRAGFDGTKGSWRPTALDADLLVAGLFDDAWFAEKNTAALGHVDWKQGVHEFPTSSPIAMTSRGGDKVWFTETDKVHYGFVDAENNIHEFKEQSQYVDVLSATGAVKGAWLRTLLVGRMMIDHIDDANHQTGYIGDVRWFAMSPDGSGWAMSNNWLTIVHDTENGEMTRYRMPCLDPHPRVFPAPSNGIWIQSLEAHCNVLLDSKGLHMRDLPEIMQVDYM